ncbi:MAG: hypothetical protein ABI333_17025 [bacterium]
MDKHDNRSPLRIFPALFVILAIIPDAQAQTIQKTTLAPRAADTLRRLEQRLGHTPRTVLRRSSPGGAMSVSRVSYLGGFDLAVPGRSADARAREFVAGFGEILGITPSHTLATAGLRSWSGGQVARYAIQVYGVPVLGHSVAVSLQGDRVTAAAGGLPPLASIDPATPALAPADLHQAVWAETGTTLHRVLGLKYLVRGDAAVLVWIAAQYRGPDHRRWVLVIDATTGQVISAGPGQQEARGYVYDPSPAVAPNPALVVLPHLTLDTALVGTYAAAHRCVGPYGDGYATPPCSQSQYGASPDGAGDYLLAPVEPSLSDGFAEVQAYYHVSRYNRWLEDRFGFAWQCGWSRRIDVFVNWGFGNAFYGDADGDSCPDITLGESGLDFAYDADVIYHELGHGLVSQTAALGCGAAGVCLDDLGVNWIPGGLNEGFADYFAMSFTDSPDLGEHIGQLLGGPIRTALNDAVCPWDLQSQVHNDGQILMGAAWELRQALGTDRTDDLMFGALLTLPEDAEYAEAAAALDQAAAELHAAGILDAAELSTVRKVLGPDGRNMAGCRRVVPLDNRPTDKPTQQVYASPTLPGTLDELPAGLQLTLTAPAGALRLDLTIEPQWDLGSSWRVYLRRNQPMQMHLDGAGVEVTADHVFEGSPGAIKLTADTSPALVPGSVYHVAIVYAAPQGELYTIRGEVQVDPTIKPDDTTGPADASVSPDGYQPDSLVWRERGGCQIGGSAPEGGLPLSLPLSLVLVLVLLGLRRAARRR